jgi:hypothetical protein
MSRSFQGDRQAALMFRAGAGLATWLNATAI